MEMTELVQTPLGEMRFTASNHNQVHIAAGATGHDGQLTINGVPYTFWATLWMQDDGSWAFHEAHNRGSWYFSLQRVNGDYDSATDAAKRKVRELVLELVVPFANDDRMYQAGRNYAANQAATRAGKANELDKQAAELREEARLLIEERGTIEHRQSRSVGSDYRIVHRSGATDWKRYG